MSSHAQEETGMPFPSTHLSTQSTIHPAYPFLTCQRPSEYRPSPFFVFLALGGKKGKSWINRDWGGE